jgi:hypothetical protein
MTDSCPNYLDVPSRMLSICPPESDSLALFGHPSMDDRLNYESSESRGKRAVASKSVTPTFYK